MNEMGLDPGLDHLSGWLNMTLFDTHIHDDLAVHVISEVRARGAKVRCSVFCKP